LEVSGPGGERTHQFLVTFDVDDDHVPSTTPSGPPTQLTAH
jgi:hypothetical protein